MCDQIMNIENENDKSLVKINAILTKKHQIGVTAIWSCVAYKINYKTKTNSEQHKTICDTKFEYIKKWSKTLTIK